VYGAWKDRVKDHNTSPTADAKRGLRAGSNMTPQRKLSAGNKALLCTTDCYLRLRLLKGAGCCSQQTTSAETPPPHPTHPPEWGGHSSRSLEEVRLLTNHKPPINNIE